MRSAFTVVVAICSLAAPLLGQAGPPTVTSTQLDSTRVDSAAVAIPRWHVGVAADIGQPVGDFRRHVNNAAGLQGHVLLRLDREGVASIRFQGGWLNYGHESQRSCIGTTPGCRVAANVTTANGIFSVGVGPQFSYPLGWLRTYGYGLIGISRFATVSGLGGGLLPDFVAADENFGDAGLAWSGGVGVQIPVHRTTSVDMSVAYQGNGRRDYLIKGGLTDNPDGTLAFDIKRSNADLFAFRIGVTTAIGWGSRKPASP